MNQLVAILLSGGFMGIFLEKKEFLDVILFRWVIIWQINANYIDSSGLCELFTNLFILTPIFCTSWLITLNHVQAAYWTLRNMGDVPNATYQKMVSDSYCRGIFHIYCRDCLIFLSKTRVFEERSYMHFLRLVIFSSKNYCYLFIWLAVISKNEIEVLGLVNDICVCVCVLILSF